MHRRWISSLAIVLVLSQTGCASWRPIRRDQIAKTLEERQPTRIRVSAAGTIVEMKQPTVVADTLVGRHAAVSRNLGLRIPLSEVDSVAMLHNWRPPAPIAASLVGVMGLVIVLWAVSIFRDPSGLKH